MSTITIADKVRPPWSATTKQRVYLLALVTEQRVVPEAEQDAIKRLVLMEDFPKLPPGDPDINNPTSASELITRYKYRTDLYPHKSYTTHSHISTSTVTIDDIAKLPMGDVKFAIPVTELAAWPHLVALAGNSDLLFGELYTSSKSKNRHMHTLKGAPGAFAREFVDFRTGDRKILVDLLLVDPIKYMRLFGEHYKCCGKCAAELTDSGSRARGFGYHCAKMIGLV